MTVGWSTSLFCYLKSSNFSPDSNHLFSAPSSSRIALVEASHHQFVYFLCPPPSHDHFNLSIAFLFSFHTYYFLICICILSSYPFCNSFYQNITVFHIHIIPFFLSDPKNQSLSSLYFSQLPQIRRFWLSMFSKSSSTTCRPRHYPHIRSFCLNEIISFYCNIPYLPRIIFHNFLWLMFILFFIYVKTTFSKYFPMNLSALLVMPFFILPLCQHMAYAIPSLLALYPFFIVNTAHFSTRIFIPVSLLNIRTVWVNDSSDFSLLAYNFMSSIKSRWLFFCLLLANDILVQHLLRFVKVVTHTTVNNGDNGSPWKTHGLMLTSPRFSSPLVNSTCHDFIPSVNLFIYSSCFEKVSTSKAPYHRPSYSLSMPLIDFRSSF